MMEVRPRTEAPVAAATSATVIGLVVENVEDSVADGGFKDEGWDVSPGHLHDAFGRDGGRDRLGHGFPFLSWSVRE